MSSTTSTISGRVKKPVAPVPVELFEDLPVGANRKGLVSAISHEVTQCDNFSPCVSWIDNKKAGRIDEMFTRLKDQWGLPDKQITQDWVDNRANGIWVDFKSKVLKDFYRQGKGDLKKAITFDPKHLLDAPTWRTLCHQFAKVDEPAEGSSDGKYNKTDRLPTMPESWRRTYMVEDNENASSSSVQQELMKLEGRQNAVSRYKEDRSKVKGIILHKKLDTEATQTQMRLGVLEMRYKKLTRN